MVRRFSFSVDACRGNLGISFGFEQFGGPRDRPGTAVIRLSRHSADLCVVGSDWGVCLRGVQQPNRSLFCNAGYLSGAVVDQHALGCDWLPRSNLAELLGF